MNLGEPEKIQWSGTIALGMTNGVVDILAY